MSDKSGMKFIKVEDHIVKITDDQLAMESVDICFGDSYMLEITKKDGQRIITNAVDGYGHNCKSKFANSKVTILTAVLDESHPQPETCDAMGHYGGEPKREGKCPKCGEEWGQPEAQPESIEAVEFAEWMHENYYYDVQGKFMEYSPLEEWQKSKYTISELYQKFLQSQNKIVKQSK